MAVKAVVRIQSQSNAHEQMARAALQQEARHVGIELEFLENGGVAPSGIPLISITDSAVGTNETSFSCAHAIRKPAEVLRSISKEEPMAQAVPVEARKAIVAITSCPTGIAHTFMAAAGLEKAAADLGYTIHVETQGSVGAKNTLTPEAIAKADLVLIAADTNVDLSRFVGKPLYSSSTQAAIKEGKKLIELAFANAEVHHATGQVRTETEQPSHSQTSAGRSAYKSLMTGVSYMLPLVTAGGLAIAISFALGGVTSKHAPGTLGAGFDQIGSSAFSVFVAILSGFIAYSIADRPGIAPGIVGGLLAQSQGAGFLGGIVSGFLAGYVVKCLTTRLKLPATLQGLMPVLILPLVGTVVVGLSMIFVIGPPVHAALDAITGWLNGMRTGNAIILGALLGGMMAADMGGPLNKAAYTFSVGLLASHVNGPMAATMAGGMTPPLGIALATLLLRNRFDHEEREAGKAAWALGLAFITEGAIPFASRDPLRVIPALVAGSAVAGGISMAGHVQLMVPHGGIFAILIPGAVSGLPIYAVALVLGTVVTTAILAVTKRPVKEVTA